MEDKDKISCGCSRYLTSMENKGYPCSKCGTLIKAGTLCQECKEKIQRDLQQIEKKEEPKQKNRKTYFSED